MASHGCWDYVADIKKIPSHQERMILVNREWQEATPEVKQEFNERAKEEKVLSNELLTWSQKKKKFRFLFDKIAPLVSEMPNVECHTQMNMHVYKA